MSRHDIVHRDIKPENVFIHNGVYKLGTSGLEWLRIFFDIFGNIEIWTGDFGFAS